MLIIKCNISHICLSVRETAQADGPLLCVYVGVCCSSAIIACFLNLHNECILRFRETGRGSSLQHTVCNVVSELQE